MTQIFDAKVYYFLNLDIIDYRILRNINPKNLDPDIHASKLTTTLKDIHANKLRTTIKCSGDPLKVLVLVLSRVHDHHRRHVIRNTYANNQVKILSYLIHLS